MAEERTEDALKNLLLTCPHHLFVCSKQVLQGAEMAVHELFKATLQLLNEMGTVEHLEEICESRPF